MHQQSILAGVSRAFFAAGPLLSDCCCTAAIPCCCRNTEISLTLPNKDGPPSEMSLKMTLASAFDGELVITKLDEQLDQQIKQQQQEILQALQHSRRPRYNAAEAMYQRRPSPCWQPEGPDDPPQDQAADTDSFTAGSSSAAAAAAAAVDGTQQQLESLVLHSSQAPASEAGEALDPRPSSPSDEYKQRYVVIKFKHGITDFLDALCMLKEACEKDADRCADEHNFMS